MRRKRDIARFRWRSPGHESGRDSGLILSCDAREDGSLWNGQALERPRKCGRYRRANSGGRTPVDDQNARGHKARGHNAGGPQCKWGRHCCRPHSHQRVVFPFGTIRRQRPIRQALGARCFPFDPASRTSGSVTGARTGIRSCFGIASGPKTGTASPPQFRDRSILGGRPSRTVPPHRRSVARHLDGQPECPARNGLLFASLSNGALASSRNLLQVSLEDRADRSATSSGFEKLPWFQTVRSSSEAAFVPFR